MSKKKEAKPMTEVPEFARSHEEACEEEGHLMHEDSAGKFCLRCPHTESA